MTKKQNIFSVMTAVMLSCILMLVSAVPVSAATTNTTKPITGLTSSIFNKSTVSSEAIYLDDSVTMTGKSALLDAKKCQYQYMVKYENYAWTTLKAYSTSTKYVWTPQQVGTYSVCIKLRSPAKITYDKYFTVTVKQKLENYSVISSAYINTDDTVSMTARAEGGEPNYQYAFLSRREGSNSWQTLSGFGNVDTMSWTPAESGTYDICIKVKDKKSKIVDKMFTLNVTAPQKTSAEYSLSIKAPVTAPYLLDCELSDSSIISVSSPVIEDEYDFINASVMIAYRIKAIRAGASTITFTYPSYSGKTHTLKYDVTVDKNLNLEVTSSSGEYFKYDTVPEVTQIKKSFSVTVEDTVPDCTWHCNVSDPNVVEVTSSTNSEGAVTYYFDVFRAGRCAVNLLYTSKSGTVVNYQMVYNLNINDNLDVETESSDGYYMKDTDLPQFQF